MIYCIMKDINKKINNLFYYNIERAFAMLNDEYYQVMCIRAYAIVPDIDFVKDIVQDVFLRIYTEKLYKKITNYESYIYICVKNQCVKYIQQRINVISIDEISLEEQMPSMNPDKRLNSLKENIQLLPPKRKKLLMHYILNDITYQELAEDMNISLNTAKDHLKKALKFLRENVSLFFI